MRRRATQHPIVVFAHRAETMTDINRHDSSGAVGHTPGAEIAMLISNILKQGSATFDPSQELLGKLDNEVERNARESARLEISEMLKQVAARRAAVPIPQVPAPPPAAPWLGDAVAARQAKLYSERLRGEAIAPAPEIQDMAADTVVDFVPDAAPAEPIETPAPLVMPRPNFERIAAEQDVAAPAQDTPVAAAAGGNDWFGHSPDGLPVWMTGGIPLAAVSVFAIGAILLGRPDGVAAALPSSEAATPVSAVHTVAAIDVDTLDSADIQPVTLRSDALRDSTLADAAALRAVAPDADTYADPVAPVAQTAAIADSSSAIAPVAANYIVREKIEPLPEDSAPAPSLKPSLPAIAPNVTTRPAVAPTPQKRPNRALPTRMYSGNMQLGSAAQLVNAVAAQAGSTLTRAEQVWLASDMERALEDEIDGRSVSLKAKDGQRIRVTMVQSEQVQREFAFARVTEISSLPHDMVVEGGWYAARRDVMLHATPAIGSGLVHRIVEKDQLIERIATYTDRYGAQWYLMGQRGLAVGFLSPADLVVGGAHRGQLGNVYSEINGAKTYEMRHVYTKCRRGYIGPFGKQMQATKFCRNAAGNWVAYQDGKDLSQIASIAGAMNARRELASAIIVAEALGDPVAYRAFADQKFRRRIRADLVNARFGQTTEHVLPDGDPIRLTFGEKYTEQSKAALKKVDALSTVSGKLTVDAEWVKAPIGATLRAAPDYLAQTSLTEIPAGQAIEKIGHVTGARGDDWVLVGRSGVGFGYVNPEKLTPINGRVSPHAIRNIRGKAVAELVDIETTCRPVSYETVNRVGQFQACQQADGSWALKGEAKAGRQFAERASDLQTAP